MLELNFDKACLIEAFEYRQYESSQSIKIEQVSVDIIQSCLGKALPCTDTMLMDQTEPLLLVFPTSTSMTFMIQSCFNFPEIVTPSGV